MDSLVPRLPNRWMNLLETCFSRQNIECSTTPPSLSTLERLCETRMELITYIAEEKDDHIRSTSEQLENLKRQSTENNRKRAAKITEIRRMKDVRQRIQAALERTNMKINNLYSDKGSMDSEAERMRVKMESLTKELETLKLGIEKPKLDELSDRLNEIRQRQAKMGEDRKPLKLREMPVILREKIMQSATHETMEAFKSTSKKMKEFVETTRFTEKEPMILEIVVDQKKILEIISYAGISDLVAGTEEHKSGPGKTTYLVKEDENALEIICADGIPLREVVGKRRVKLDLIVNEEVWTSEIYKKIIETFKNCQVDILSVSPLGVLEPEEMWVAFGKPRLEMVGGDVDIHIECMNCIRRLPLVTDLVVNFPLEDDPEIEIDFDELIEEWKAGTREIKKWIWLSSCFQNREEKVIRRECDGKVMTIKCTNYNEMTFSVSD